MPAPTARPGRGPLIKAYAASLTGTALEYYDFAVYSAAAALVFPQLFFPGEDPLTGTLLSFSTYAVGFLARPVGGIVFGRLGDRVGRKNVLVWTLMLIGAATLLIGLLPGYASIGVAAPIILVLLRFAQGVGVGGEWGGAVLLSSEYGDPAKRGFWASAAQIGPPAGNLLANGVLAVLAAALTEEAFLSWGWRVAFLISAVLVGFGLWIRLKLEDTPVFQAIKESGERPKAPIKEVFATQKRALTAAALARVGPDVLYALFTVFVATYATQVLGMTRSQVLTAVLLGSAPAATEAQMWLWSLGPGERYEAEPDPAGWHEMIFVTEGTLRLELSGMAKDYPAGSFAVYATDRAYAYANPGEGVVRFVRNVVA